MPGQYSQKNLAAAQHYLADRAAAGQWTPTKSIGDYQPAQIVRKANSFKAQEQSGLPISNQASRGHGLTEHGKPSGIARTPQAAQYRAATVRAASKPAYTPAQRLARSYRGGTVRTVQVSRSSYKGKESWNSKQLAEWHGTGTWSGGQRAERLLSQLSAQIPDSIVRVQWRDQDGKWHETFRHGVSARTAGTRDGHSFLEWLNAAIEEQYQTEPGELQVVEWSLLVEP